MIKVIAPGVANFLGLDNAMVALAVDATRMRRYS